jgi:Leucine-rich repeat (LRR) protein
MEDRIKVAEKGIKKRTYQLTGSNEHGIEKIPKTDGQEFASELNSGSLSYLLRLPILPTIPSAISDELVTRLILTKKGLHYLPQIGHLTNLSLLDLSGNLLTELSGISTLTRLTQLSITYNKLEIFPSPIFLLINLNYLNIKGNQLSEVPSGIGSLTNLTKLDFSRNKLTSISSAIGNLTNLTVLHLNCNCLTEIPNAIGELVQLRSLNLWVNLLRTIPIQIGNLTNLQDFWIGRTHRLELETDTTKPMYSTGSELVFYYSWSPSTHALFPSQLRRSVKTMILAFRIRSRRVPNEILRHILSYICVDHRITMK